MSATAESMSAVRWHGRGDVRLDRVSRPLPAAGEVLIQVEMCGLCGTDSGEVSDGPLEIPSSAPHPLTGRRAPIILGHEVVGHVVEIGPDTAGIAVGSRVIPDVVIGCGHCWWCRRHEEGLCETHAVRGLHTDGGLAEFMTAKADTLVPIQAHLSAETAVLAEPLSVAVRALRKAGDLTGAVVSVYGVGAIGQLISRLALRAGAAVIAVDVAADHVALAAHAGATGTTPEAAQDTTRTISRGRGADVAFECSGVPGGVAASVALTRRGGRTVLVGVSAGAVQLEHADLVIGEKQMVGSASHLWDEDMTTAVRLLQAGAVTEHDLPVRVIGLDDAPAALLRPDTTTFKTVVRPGPAPWIAN